MFVLTILYISIKLYIYYLYIIKYIIRYSYNAFLDQQNNWCNIYLSGSGIKIRFWNLLRKAESSSQGQLVAHRRKILSDRCAVSAPSICFSSSVLIRRLYSSSRELRCLQILSISSIKITCQQQVKGVYCKFFKFTWLVLIKKLPTQ